MGCGASWQRLGTRDESGRWAQPVSLDPSILREFCKLDQGGKVLAEYVLIDVDSSDGKAFDLCSKTLTLDAAPESISDLPSWGISGDDGTDVHMVPRRIYRDPFRRGDNILVLTDCYYEAKEGSCKDYGSPARFNTRARCEATMALAAEMQEDPWFGIEQEYYLLDARTGWPLGWPKGSCPGKHKEGYYCSTGATKAIGRDIVEAHARACLYAGIKFGGINSEEAPAQWEFQVGPLSGVGAADDLWMARYILQRVCEIYQVGVTFDPKPVQGWPGIGCHTNYSTIATRTKPGGMDAMLEQIQKLRERHKEHLAVYGKGNERRLTGKDDTAAMKEFSFGVADRSASIRIGRKVAERDCGYYEDRRPAANMDPYVVTAKIVQSTLLETVRLLGEVQRGPSLGLPSKVVCAPRDDPLLGSVVLLPGSVAASPLSAQ